MLQQSNENLHQKFQGNTTENHQKSHPKASKFRNKSFPLFDSLEELYDGQIAEGTFSFTSIAPSQVPATQPSQFSITQPPQPTLTQPSQFPSTHPSQPTLTQPSQPATSDQQPFQPYDNVETDDHDDELRILEKQPSHPAANDADARSRLKKRVGTSEKTEKAAQMRRQDGQVVGMIGKFLELKEKQHEREREQQEREREDDFPIPVCITTVDSMEDLSDDEKIEAYDVFKDPQNRAIFMTAKDSTRLKWLRKKIRAT